MCNKLVGNRLPTFFSANYSDVIGLGFVFRVLFFLYFCVLKNNQLKICSYEKSICHYDELSCHAGG